MDIHTLHILTDEQLVKMAQEGSETAEEILIEKYKSLVKNKAKTYYIAGADNEDVVQEGMIGRLRLMRIPVSTIRFYQRLKKPTAASISL